MTDKDRILQDIARTRRQAPKRLRRVGAVLQENDAVRAIQSARRGRWASIIVTAASGAAAWWFANRRRHAS